MCIFCQIVSGEAPSWTIYQDNLVTAFFNYFPASPGHLLIIPNEHYENIFEIPEDTLAHLAKVSKRIAHVYKDILGVKDINILQNNGAQAGQTVFHYHMHLVPRSQGDSITFHWDADESLREQFDEMKERLKKELS